MARFLVGLALGLSAAGPTYGLTGSSYWTCLTGAVAAVGIWTWPLILDELT